ncbi:Multifunctional pyrimidine synthesis protein CAD [Tilletia horrida]|uniref:Carbamoyl phosphate synthase arginine-specific small chain n=1 Tax=Tilletia horrida TaxID=155126 RepID=A0AAN6GDJ3_9BASI|nr:Multifunctional pyrimidine synthesis protein CAD [Tilletia horrida]KAK0531306.1 Multifunctional pyrimidine synthesis protein CAD [Tilletia horrida]KAK0532795.1 Multifunctional pyrimidine synthesis protein CAD [Tilletia horrida]
MASHALLKRVSAAAARCSSSSSSSSSSSASCFSTSAHRLYAAGVAPVAQDAITWTQAPPSQPATLHLKTGQKFPGRSFGAPRSIFGETVFTTSITSYTESLTDPSYQGQLLAFTQPMMGNYGVPDNFSGRSPAGHPKDVDVGAFLESNRLQAAGIIVSNLSERFSHYEARESLSTWAARHNVPGISGIDTRALTTLLRDQGSTLGAIVVGEGHDQTPSPDAFVDPMAENLIARVSTSQPYTIHPVGGASAARVHIALLDFGCKANILRSLLRCGASVTVLPWNYDFNRVRDAFDGLFLSNGPGSPYSIPEAIATVKKTIEEWRRPIFGICMGNQIIGIAAGLKAYRMKFGNRGHNQPVVALASVGNSVRAGRVYITSQNHGYALEYNHGVRPGEEGSWPKGWIPWFVNANDGSIEGIKSTPDSGKAVWAAQFHPEHSGGPEDCAGMFEDYVAQVEHAKQSRRVESGSNHASLAETVPAELLGEAPRGQPSDVLAALA